MINITAGHQDVRLLLQKKLKKTKRRLRPVFCWMPKGEKARFLKVLRNENMK